MISTSRFARSFRHVGRLLSALAGAVVLANATAASAATIGISGNTLIAGAARFEQIALEAAVSGTDLLLTGVAFEIVTPGCSLDGVASVRCALAGFTTVTLIGSDLADVIDVSDIGALNVFVAAKDGDDVILGGDGPEILSGGAGDDVFIGGSILNIIFEGSGNNIIIGGRRSDEDPPPDPEPLQPVPEPAVLFIVGLGVSACLARRQRRTSTTQPSLRR